NCKPSSKDEGFFYVFVTHSPAFCYQKEGIPVPHLNRHQLTSLKIDLNLIRAINKPIIHPVNNSLGK
ncbi:hypothetical protein, partial [Enterobacter asburiae]|uniref:hypothetical protein n=1 Tax=Enterobacter asburiae TaxID=61645 RepID=UPI0030765384